MAKGPRFPGKATALPTSQDTGKTRSSPAPGLPVLMWGNMQEWREIYEERSLFII